MTNIRELLAERDKTHGRYEDYAQTTQDILRVFMRYPGWSNLTPSMRATFFMDAHKKARILCGDPNFLDHWQDIVGYNQLIVDQLVALQEPKAVIKQQLGP